MADAGRASVCVFLQQAASRQGGRAAFVNKLCFPARVLSSIELEGGHVGHESRINFSLSVLIHLSLSVSCIEASGVELVRTKFIVCGTYEDKLHSSLCHQQHWQTAR